MRHFFNSTRREARRLGQSPWDLAMVTWVPVLAVVLVVWIFSSAIPRNLPVGVMDEDHSALSRQLVRMLNASPGMQVVDEFDSESSVQLALREVRVYGMINIPRDFERDIKRGIKAEVILRHNAQFATHSSLLQRDVRTVVGTLAAGIEMSARNKRGESAQQAKVSFNPIQIQSIALFNGSGNYEKYLTAAAIPAILHILAMTAGLPGPEDHPRQSQAWQQDGAGAFHSRRRPAHRVGSSAGKAGAVPIGTRTSPKQTAALEAAFLWPSVKIRIASSQPRSACQLQPAHCKSLILLDHAT